MNGNNVWYKSEKHLMWLSFAHINIKKIIYSPSEHPKRLFKAIKLYFYYFYFICLFLTFKPPFELNVSLIATRNKYINNKYYY